MSRYGNGIRRRDRWSLRATASRNSHCAPTVRGNRKERLDRADRTAVEDAEGHARPAPSEAARRRGPRGEDRDRPRPLRAFPPASGSWRRDTGGDLLRTGAVAPVSDPAPSWQAGRRPAGLSVPHRPPRCGTAAAGASPKSSLKGRARRSAKGAGVGRRLPAGHANNDETAGLCAPKGVAITIAPLQVR
jgi:hypothetical protein